MADTSILIGIPYVVMWGLENKHQGEHHTDTCLKEIGLCLQILLASPHLIVNATLGGPMYLIEESMKPCILGYDN